MIRNSKIFENVALLYKVFPIKVRINLILLLLLSILLSLMELFGIYLFGLYTVSLGNLLKNADYQNKGIFSNLLTNLISHFHINSTFDFALVVLIFFLIKMVFALILSLFIYRYLATLSIIVSDKLITNFSNSKYELVKNYEAQKLGFSFSDALNSISIGTLVNLIGITVEAILLIGLSGLLIINNIFLGLFILAYFIFVGLILHFMVAKKIRKLSNLQGKLSIENRDQIIDFQQMLSEANTKVTKDFFTNKFKHTRKKVVDNYAVLEWYLNLPKNLIELTTVFLIFLLSLFVVSSNSNKIGLLNISIFVLIIFRASPSLIRLQSNWLSLNRSFGYFEQVKSIYKDLLTESNASTYFSHKLKFIPDSNEIRIENMAFSYTSDYLFGNVNLVFTQGQKIAVIGDSASGKSTFLKLVAGILSPYEGSIEYGDYFKMGDDLDVTYVPQSPYIFNGTVFENLTFGLYEAGDLAPLKDVLENFRLTGLISSFPTGLEYDFLTNGTELSGGQKQRLAIVRSIIREAKILCLDEHLSALDFELGSAIEESLNVDSSKRITFIATHDYRRLETCDMVLYIDSNRVTQFSNLAEMIKFVPKSKLQSTLQGIELF